MVSHNLGERKIRERKEKKEEEEEEEEEGNLRNLDFNIVGYRNLKW